MLKFNGAIGALALASVHTLIAAETRDAVSLPMITEIIIEGTKNIHKDRILFLIKSREGNPFRSTDVSDDVRAINAMGAFTNVKSKIEVLEGNKIKLYFVVSELPFITDLSFTGLGYWDTQGLDKKIKTKKAGYLNPLVLENDKKVISDYFAGKSFPDVSITTEVIEKELGTVNVVFDISLNQDLKIAENKYSNLPDGAYKVILDAKLINKPFSAFKENAIDLDKNTLIVALQHLGYLDAKVICSSINFYDSVRPSDRGHRGVRIVSADKKRDRIIVSWDIEAGERYHFDSISFIGSKTATEETLVREFDLKQGVIYKDRDIRKAIRNVRSYIMNQGYARAGFRVDRQPIDGHKIKLVMHINEGKKYIVGDVEIHGNTVTKDAVIRRLISLRPGESYKEDDLDETKRQIVRSGFFDSKPGHAVLVRKLFDPSKPEEVDVLVELEETGTGSFSASLGYQETVGLLVQLSFTERNFDLLGLLTEGRFRGGGQNFSTSVQWSENKFNISTSWSNPHLFDSRYFLASSSSFTKSDSSATDWDEDKTMVSFRLGRNFLNNDLKLSVGYKFLNMSIYNVDSDASNDVDKGVYRTNSITLKQEYDITNHPVIPTKGFNVKLEESMTGGLLPSDYDYLGFALTANEYLPLFESDLGGVTLLHFRQRYETLRSIDGSSVPFYDRIYGGGAFPKHRGFRGGYLGPEEINGDGSVSRTGGINEFLFTLQLMTPLQGTNAGFKGVVFMDNGFVWGKDESVDLSDLKTAIGFGVRLPPSFPLSLDFAWLIEDGSLSEKHIHFSIMGMSF